MMTYYAHSLPGRPKEEWQKLDDHLRAVAEMAADFASCFGSSDWAWNAGWLLSLQGGAKNHFIAIERSVY